MFTLLFNRPINLLLIPSCISVCIFILYLSFIYIFSPPADNVFGCHLATLCAQEKTTVPSFVEKCINAVEKRGTFECPVRMWLGVLSWLRATKTLTHQRVRRAGLDIDGLYRVSGNLAVIQKLRFKADHGESPDMFKLADECRRGGRRRPAVL